MPDHPGNVAAFPRWQGSLPCPRCHSLIHFETPVTPTSTWMREQGGYQKPVRSCEGCSILVRFSPTPDPGIAEWKTLSSPFSGGQIELIKSGG